MVAGVVPQSSWSFSPMAPPSACSTSTRGFELFPFPSCPMLTGMPAKASIIRWRLNAPGASMPTVFGPVPPPIMVVIPFDSASQGS